MRWTSKEIETVTKRWRAGERASLIAKDMGRSREAVLGKLHRLKLLAVDPNRRRQALEDYQRSRTPDQRAEHSQQVRRGIAEARAFR